MQSAKLQSKNQNLEEKAYEYAMFLLNIRLRTEGELREKLKSKNYELGIRNQVIQRLKDQNFVNDKRFAEVYLENLKKYKTWGYFGIKKKLMEKRLSMSLIEGVLLEGLSEEEELEIAKRYCSSLSRTTTNLASRLRSKTKFVVVRNFLPPEKQKIAKKLVSKGFRSSVVSKILF